MPSYIIKLKHEDKAYYLEWSTIVDAPVTYGMPLGEFREYYRDRYGEDGMEKLTQRLDRVERKGTSSFIENSAEDVLSCNRAGKNETELTKEQIIEWFCIKRQEPDIEGKDWRVEIAEE